MIILSISVFSHILFPFFALLSFNVYVVLQCWLYDCVFVAENNVRIHSEDDSEDMKSGGEGKGNYERKRGNRRKKMKEN